MNGDTAWHRHDARRPLRTKEYETIYVLRSDVDADTAEKVQARVAEVVEREHGQARQGRGLGPPQAGVPGRQAAQGRLRLREVRGRRRPRRRGRAQPEAPGRRHEVPDGAHARAGRPRGRPDRPRGVEARQRSSSPPEAEEQESREKQLGLVDFGPERRAACAAAARIASRVRRRRRPRGRAERRSRRAAAADEEEPS